MAQFMEHYLDKILNKNKQNLIKENIVLSNLSLLK